MDKKIKFSLVYLLVENISTVFPAFSKFTNAFAYKFICEKKTLYDENFLCILKCTYGTSPLSLHISFPPKKKPLPVQLESFFACVIFSIPVVYMYISRQQNMFY